MKICKKLLIFLVAAISLILAVSGCGSDKTADPLTYTLSADGSFYEVSAERKNNLETVSITVPASYDGKPVVIKARAFYGLPELETVIIEGASGEIPTQAFMNCPKLTSVRLEGNAVVQSKCFNSCIALESITFSSGITSIGSECVSGCPALKSIVIGDDCTTIGAKAFYDCKNLTSVTLGKNLSKIGASAFANDAALTQIDFPTEKELLLESYAFSYCGLQELRIPANVRLGEGVFDHLAWDESLGEAGASRCKAVYFYSTEPTVDSLGMNSIGYTWDRTAEDIPELGDFMVYVPEGYEDIYAALMREECDESWVRCVLDRDRLATFLPDTVTIE